VSRQWGADRGLPIDRYYIEHFLRMNSSFEGYAHGYIRGRVLEIGDDYYAQKFGTRGGGYGDVASIDVLHVDASNPKATIVADLAAADDIPADSFDCILCVQTLLLIYDIHAAIQTLHRILAPGGALLATMPGITPVARPEADLWGDHWRVTGVAARRLFGDVFAARNVTVATYGNVLSAAAFLYGLAAEDLRHEELEVHDPAYEVTIAVRALKHHVIAPAEHPR
jgi:SAM-dependent methyltransferase